MADAQHEVPLGVIVTKGNVWDGNQLLPLLRETRNMWRSFAPAIVMADAGYSSDAIRETIRETWYALPLIDPNKAHPASRLPWKADWKVLYRKRTSVERLYGRLKQHRRLNSLTWRGLAKATIHACLSVITSQATYLVMGGLTQVRAV